MNPYLTFVGNAEEALEHYRAALGGEARVLRYAGSPAESHAPPGWGDKIMHARLETPLGVIMLSDAPPGHAGKAGDNFSIALHVDTDAQAESIFAKLSEGGEVTMPLGKTFWAEKFGMCTDKYGVGWMVNYGEL